MTGDGLQKMEQLGRHLSSSSSLPLIQILPARVPLVAPTNRGSRALTHALRPLYAKRFTLEVRAIVAINPQPRGEVWHYVPKFPLGSPTG